MIPHLFTARRHTALILTLLLLGTTILSSCASNRLVSSWENPVMADKKVVDVLVIGVFRDKTIRRLYENSFARGLQAENVKTYVGHSVDAVKTTIVHDTVVEAAKATGAKTVLITRYVDATRETTTTRDALGRIYLDMVDVPIGPGMMYVTPSTSTNTNVKVHLETLLYDVPTKKLIWSARSEIINPVMTNKYLDSVTNLYVAELKKNNMF